ncbi:MAG: hypothetical protein DCC50_10490 [Acidobacteria bacterium]|nr:MAG: hypothetical protein DCC50_10490 [Acidobacteriota bacterium]
MQGRGTVGAGSSTEKVERRDRIAGPVAQAHGGVARRQDLLAAGLTRHDIDGQLRRRLWHRAGRHTVVVEGSRPEGEGRYWQALWELGPRSVLDGPTALVVSGLTSWTEEIVHVSVPRNATVGTLEGVRRHVLRDVGPAITTGLRRTKPHVAAVRAAEWARSDRAAATLLAMTVQQRLVSTEALLQRWESVRRSRRRRVLDGVIRDICDGAHSINELDVADACRARGIRAPSRQQVRTGPAGRVYLDLFWDEEEVHAEVQGAHHFVGLKVVDDSLRVNDLAISSRALISLQIPVLGWRVSPDRFLDQIAAALEEGGRRRRARALPRSA